MSIVRITESRDPVADPPPSGLAVLALTRFLFRGGWEYRRIRAMRLDTWALEAPDNAFMDSAEKYDWDSSGQEAYWPAGWYECTAYAANLPDCDGALLIPMEGEAEVVAWMELPRFTQQDEVPA